MMHSKKSVYLQSSGKVYRMFMKMQMLKNINLCKILYASEQSSRVVKKRESVISTAATMRVLNIIKHWVSKHQQVTMETKPSV